jgi:hypothetical protein
MCTFMVGCARGGATPAGRPAQPPPDRATDYYPLDAGWRWAYDVERGQERILATYAVLERIGDTAIVQAGEERLGYAVRPDGIARREGLELGDYLLKTPVRAGTSWPVAGGTARVTAVGETATVPAGTYPDCAVVEETRTNPDRVIRTTYAARVGPVLVQYLEHDPASGRYRPVLQAALRGVTRPGEDPLGGPPP